MDLATLRKILELERSKGYGDSAVLGGLDRYLQRWSSELPKNVLPTSYASLGIEQRVEWVEGMLHSLDKKKVKARSGPVRSAKKVKARSVPVHSEKKAAVNENLDAPIDTIKGLSTKLSPKFRRLGVETVRDMLYFFPRRHIDYSKRKTIAELGIGDEQTVIATVCLRPT